MSSGSNTLVIVAFSLTIRIRCLGYDNWMFFAKRYCDAKKMFRTLKNGSKKQIWLTDGASNLDELSVKTKNLIIRRLKTDVLDMPDKVITPVYHQLDKNGWVEYDRLWDDYLEKRKAEDNLLNKPLGVTNESITTIAPN